MELDDGGLFMLKSMLFASGFAAVGLLAGVTAYAPGTDEPKSKGTVLLFLSTDCPVAMQYTPRINRLVEEFEPKGFGFKAVFPNEGEEQARIETYVSERKYAFPWERDPGAKLARAKGVKTVPTAVVLDPEGQVVYLGAIDDSKLVDQVKKPYLRDVLAAVAAGKKPPVERTEAFGCILMPGAEAPSVETVTFSDHVAKIVYDHCTKCHRPGEVAPFSLTSYEDARKWADNIAYVAEKRTMPPWKAVAGFGDFHDENRLTDVQIETLQNWAKAKAPRGNPDKEPKPPTFPPGWALGEPDLILMPEKPFKVPAEGRDIYRHFVLKTNLKEPVWVTAIDSRPGNRKVVHHVIAFLDDKGRAQKMNGRDKDGQDGYNAFGAPGFIPDGALGGWAPGTMPIHLPEGTGFLLKPGTDVVLQVHYHPTGKEEIDQTKLGIYFTKVPAKKEVEIAWLANPLFRLKAGDANATVRLNVPIRQDTICYGVMPHMHLLGKSMKADVLFPDGTVKPMVWVQDWDFNWQLTYAFKEPMRIPKGSRIRIEAVYDNSADNPNNPNDPPKDIFWGEETTDEMFLLVAMMAKD